MTLEIHHIVCGVDFSEPSLAALDTAIAWARAHDAALHVVHAYSVPPMPYLEAGIVVVDEARLVAAIERDLCARVAARGASDVRVECRAAVGLPAPALLRAAHDTRCDLVVVGTRGLGPLPRLLVGSVADRIARTAPMPVLVVPEAAPAVAPIRAVLCAEDFSPPSLSALRAAAQLAAKHGAALHVVHAWEPPAALARHPELASAHEAELERALDVAASSIPAQSTRAVRRGAPFEVIADEVRAQGSDLVVLGSTGQSGPAQFLLGSVAERVLRVSEVPVLVVRG